MFLPFVLIMLCSGVVYGACLFWAGRGRRRSAWAVAAAWVGGVYGLWGPLLGLGTMFVLDQVGVPERLAGNLSLTIAPSLVAGACSFAVARSRRMVVTLLIGAVVAAVVLWMQGYGLLLAAPVWLLFACVPLVIRGARHKRPMDPALCRGCGYRVETLERCPECGILRG